MTIDSIYGTVERLIKDTPNKGHNRIHLHSKDTVCGPKWLFCILYSRLFSNGFNFRIATACRKLNLRKFELTQK